MGKKNQSQQKMSLGDFLGDQTLGSWADEMEDMPVASGDRAGFGGDRRAQGFDRAFDRFAERGFATREQLPMPSKPPYTAHLGNLSFDAMSSDVDAFFEGCDVTNVRIVEDKIERKPKGFGYVEFRTVEGLQKALDLSGTQFQGRNIRVSVAEPPKDRAESKDMSDWTRKGPLPDLSGQGRRASDRGGYRHADAASEAGSDRGERRRPPPFEGDGKSRDFGNWERKGPLSPVPASGPVREGGRLRTHDAPRERRQSPAWGEGRSQEGSRPPRREFQERPSVERQATASEMDSQWRSKMRPDPPAKSPTATPDASVPSSPATQPAPPAVRPRLNLAKRTVSEAEPSPVSATSTDSKSNPFGAARPIDTAAREKEIEEKRQLAVRHKRDAEDKARDEKKTTLEAAKTTDKGKGHQSSPLSPTAPSSAQGKENGSEGKSPNQTSESAHLATENGEVQQNATTPATSTNGGAVSDKGADAARDAPQGAEGSWKKRSSPAAAGPGESEGDGWNTVTKANKSGRRVHPSRAAAS